MILILWACDSSSLSQQRRNGRGPSPRKKRGAPRAVLLQALQLSKYGDLLLSHLVVSSSQAFLQEVVRRTRTRMTMTMTMKGPTLERNGRGGGSSALGRARAQVLCWFLALFCTCLGWLVCVLEAAYGQRTESPGASSLTH